MSRGFEIFRRKLYRKRTKINRGLVGDQTFQISIKQEKNVILDHQALLSAINASERSKTSQSRLTRWIDSLILFNFDIKHLGETKIGLKNYMSRYPVGSALPPVNTTRSLLGRQLTHSSPTLN